MDMNNNSVRVDKDSTLPSNVRILLIDHDTTLLMKLASQFEKHLYKVTTTESAEVALILFRERKNYYNIVIVDRHMPEMDIYEFVHEIHRQPINNIPIILIDENPTTDTMREAINNGVCFVLEKPLSQLHISGLCQDIFRVTGEMPSHIDVEKYVNPSSGSLNMNIINHNRGNIKRRMNHIVEDSKASFDNNEDVGSNSKKSRMTWTPPLQEKFLRAIENLGEEAAHPKKILSMMNEPALTYRHVASHLQKHKNRKRNSVDQHRGASRFMPSMMHAPLQSIIVGGQASGTTNTNNMETQGAPQIQRSLSWIEAPNCFGCYANTEEEALLCPPTFGHGTMKGNPEIVASGHLSTGLPVPNNEQLGAIDDVIQSSGLLSNGLQACKEAPTGLINDVVITSGHLSNGLKAPNRESSGDIRIRMRGLENMVNPMNVNNYSFVENTSGSQPIDGMPSEEEVNNFLHHLSTSKFWDWFNKTQ